MKTITKHTPETIIITALTFVAACVFIIILSTSSFLPSYSVVCDGAGNWGYTGRYGSVFPATSRADAENSIRLLKAIREERETREKASWHVCH